MKINLFDNKGFKWHSSGNCFVKGYAFTDDNQLLKENSLINYFGLFENPQGFIDKIKNLNGSFCIIFDYENSVIVGVDRLSSIPIFYTTENTENISLFDKLKINQFSIDNSLVADFLQTGYTTSNQTLVSNIYRLSAGQYLIFDKQSKSLDVNYYYRHFHGNLLHLTQAEHFRNLENITNNFISRLIRSVNGRTIVIPLSGGYDSRYIVTGLRKHNYENVICYTYGKEDSFEMDIAGKVAAKLNYPIIKVEYKSENWKKLKDNPYFLDYVNYSFNFSSLTHVQDFLALEYLTKNGLIPKDSVIVPGFCGDLLGGSLIPVEILQNSFESLKDEGFENYIIRRHTLFKSDIKIDLILPKQNLLNYLDQTNIKIQTEEDFISLNECWTIEHRLSKFVINSLRVYEYFGFEWRMPLWDNELVEYWYTVPFNLRVRPKLYDKFLSESLFSPLGVDFQKKAPFSTSKSSVFLERVFSQSVLKFLIKVYRRIFKYSDYNSFNFFRDSLLTEIENKTESLHTNQMNAVLALWIIENQKKIKSVRSMVED